MNKNNKNTASGDTEGPHSGSPHSRQPAVGQEDRRIIDAQKEANRAMWFGILSGLAAPILAPLALYYGFRAHARLGRGGVSAGRRKAVVGIILGAFWLLMVLLVILLRPAAAR